MEDKYQNIYKFTIPTPFSVGDVNVYLIEGELLTLVDTGPKTVESWESLLTQLSNNHYSIEDIDQIIITHHHPDHCGLIDWILKKKKIPVLGHPNSNPWISQDKEFSKYCRNYFLSLYKKMGVPSIKLNFYNTYHDELYNYACEAEVTTYITEGADIPGLKDWKVFETPGHSQSHIVLYRESDGVLIAGDHIINHISSNALLEPPKRGESIRPKPLIQYRDSLLKCKDLKISIVYTGHGDEVTNLTTLINDRIKMQNKRAEKIKALINNKPKTAFEICEKLFPNILENELVLAMSEVIGHIDLLIEREEIVVHNENPLIYYECLNN